MLVLRTYDQVSAALADDRLTVPPPPGRDSALGWLRSAVCRFSSGAAHSRRRALVEAPLRALSPDALRRSARGRAPETAAVEVLAEALSVIVDPAVVVAAARAYLPPVEPTPADDAAVAALLAALGGVRDEPTAARACLLVQACASTAGLIRNALPYKDFGEPEAVLAETLRHSPPIPVLRRQRPDGTLVELDLVAANRDPTVFADPSTFDVRRPSNKRHLTFGVGLRPCPGDNHALAIAAGVLEGSSR
ncbi:cytochrome P450 [Allokutzneria sp. A3M-2-11 16]|uniref:cytochrome P450 n=1 Tax=Allokutzneria sp. A3M-2-11 16 TaxID=2962043 RepID=UPI0020B6C998|nr:cytochrome P450 [Allokutzneria sp. A3M-2-11 16]MCP3805162.1 cytochrome P450 [Allokutzneria sp. A3M-2-11 16]